MMTESINELKARCGYVYIADSLGTFYDEVEEFKNEFFIKSGSYKERIHCAAEWLKNAIENKTVKVE